MSRAAWAERVAVWFPELIDPKARSLAFGEISWLRDQIEVLLDEVTVSTAWQRLRDEHGLQAGLTSLRRYVRLEEFEHRQASERATVLRPQSWGAPKRRSTTGLNAASCLAWPSTSQMVESTSTTSRPEPGPAPMAHARASARPRRIRAGGRVRS